MKKLTALQHALGQPFVLATGMAALIHSTWSLATLFGGMEPDFGKEAGKWFLWAVPAMLIAFSVDVGQIITASEIRRGQRGWMKYATFGIFAVATYMLQWFHLANHIPNLVLSSGVLPDQLVIANFLREAMLWAIPALLPVATLLYTFSSQEVEQEEVQVEPLPPLRVSVEERPVEREKLELLPVDDAPQIESGVLIAKCPYCDFEKPCYNELSVKRTLSAHSRGCKGLVKVEADNPG